MNEIELEPCPNPECGSTNIDVVAPAYHRGHYMALCRSCQTAGPHATSEEETRSLWNALPRTAALQWTPEPPSEPGIYPYREVEGATNLAEVALDKGELVMRVHVMWYRVSELSGLWLHVNCAPPLPKGEKAQKPPESR